MRRIFISFLGAGTYHSTIYHIGDKKAEKSKYVQAAELQLKGADYFDKIFLVMTKTSKKMHYESLTLELKQLGIQKIHEINITEKLTPENQWDWFEQILIHIDHGDELTVDMTHGYRIVPIVFSAALNFLQKAKNIQLKSVYYGAYESNKDLSPVVDIKDFYIINEWTDAVSRLVEDADPGKLGQVAQQNGSTILNEFDDPELIAAFDELTQSLKNVDIHNVSKKAVKALDIVSQKEKTASKTGQILLGLVKDKFISLVTKEPVTGKYDHYYFKLQLAIIRILLDHKLFMQAYTVMREMLGSFGLIRMKDKAKIYNKQGRNQRTKAEVFISMLSNKETTWKFSGHRLRINQKLLPLYRDMEKHGILKQMRHISNNLIKYRNGFDHAWTSKAKALDNIEVQGNKFHEYLNLIVHALQQYNFF